MISEFPPGSRSQNIGGTGSPQRVTSFVDLDAGGVQRGVVGIDVDSVEE